MLVFVCLSLAKMSDEEEMAQVVTPRLPKTADSLNTVLG